MRKKILKNDIGLVPDDMVDLDVVPEELDNIVVGDLIKQVKHAAALW